MRSFFTFSANSGLENVFTPPQVDSKNLPSLGRAFRKEDVQDRGRISVDAFRKILSAYGITFRDPNEIYKMLSKYDRKMRGHVNYEKFLRAVVWDIIYFQKKSHQLLQGNSIMKEIHVALQLIRFPQLLPLESN